MSSLDVTAIRITSRPYDLRTDRRKMETCNISITTISPLRPPGRLEEGLVVFLIPSELGWMDGVSRSLVCA